VEYATSAVLMVRMVLAADESLAAILDRIKLGMAMAAMMRMIATTISSSINEKPFCLRIENLLWKIGLEPNRALPDSFPTPELGHAAIHSVSIQFRFVLRTR